MANQITAEDIRSKIKSETYLVLPDGRTTLCVLSLENGFTITGTSACVHAANFNIDTGRQYAHAEAFRKIWELEGYLLAQRLYENPPVTLTVPTVLEEAKKQLDAEIEKWKARTAPKKRGRPRNNDAPFGLKKDGTPKKRPGRAPKV